MLSFQVLFEEGSQSIPTSNLRVKLKGTMENCAALLFKGLDKFCCKAFIRKIMQSVFSEAVLAGWFRNLKQKFVVFLFLELLHLHIWHEGTETLFLLKGGGGHNLRKKERSSIIISFPFPPHMSNVLKHADKEYISFYQIAFLYKN